LRVSLASIEKVNKTFWREIEPHVENLATAYHGNTIIEPSTQTWLAGVNDELHAEFARLGFVQPRVKPEATVVVTVSSLLAKHTEAKLSTLEDSSLARMKIELSRFEGWAGVDRDIRTFTVGSASDFTGWLAGKVASEAAQRTCNRYVKAMFAYAVEHEWLSRNPFEKLKASPLAANRAHYVTPEQTELILKAVDSYFVADTSEAIQWRLLIGLARYAGLRTPSETHAITWRGVDWANNALVVQVRKTRRYAATRTVPIIPELLPILQAGYDHAPEGASTILTVSQNNLYRKLTAILEAAGIAKWDDLFQTLRQSCETHLVSLGHPQHAVSQWLGHSERVSKDHYLMVTTDAFSKATTTRTEVADRPQPPVRAKVRAHQERNDNPPTDSRKLAGVADQETGRDANSEKRRRNVGSFARGNAKKSSEMQWPGLESNQRHTDFQSDNQLSQNELETNNLCESLPTEENGGAHKCAHFELIPSGLNNHQAEVLRLLDRMTLKQQAAAVKRCRELLDGR